MAGELRSSQSRPELLNQAKQVVQQDLPIFNSDEKKLMLPIYTKRLL